MRIFEETAFSIGARLCRDAIWQADRCNWIGPSMEPRRGQWTVVTRALGPDLYAGTAGIGWFLSRLYRRTGERLFQKTALGALAHAESKRPKLGQQLSFYGGVTGVCCAMLEAGQELGCEHYVHSGRQALDALFDAELTQQGLDVVTGLAGAIPALLRLYTTIGLPACLDLAIRCGDWLALVAKKRDSGWSWATIGDENSPHLTGFSHGSAGFGWAFLELFHATREAKYREWAEAAFGYERLLFDAQQGNWPDLRLSFPGGPVTGSAASNAGTQHACALAWCHGAPGIGLSRLRAFEVLGDPVCRSEAEVAIGTTMRALESPYAMTGGFSLCHGSAGNAELLLEGARILERPSLRAAVVNLGVRAAEAFEATGEPWICGVNGAGESPSLLLGLAGIGYFYLRLLDEGTGSLLCYGPGWPAARTASVAA